MHLCCCSSWGLAKAYTRAVVSDSVPALQSGARCNPVQGKRNARRAVGVHARSRQ
jgi:hypothetical protein